MSTIVYRIAVLLSALWADVPIGTDLGLFWLLWTLLSGRCLRSRDAVFPALADEGLPAEAVRRAGTALAYGRWAIQTLVPAWHQVVAQEGGWHAHRSEEFRPVAWDLVGFFRPRLSGISARTTTLGLTTRCRPPSSRSVRRSVRSVKSACHCSACSYGPNRATAVQAIGNHAP